MFLLWYLCWSLLDLLSLPLIWLWLLFLFWLWLCELRFLFCFSYGLEFRPWHYFVQDLAISLGWLWWNNLRWWSFDLLDNLFMLSILLNYLFSLCYNLINIFDLFLFLMMNLFFFMLKIRIDNRSINCNIFRFQLFFIFIHLILWLFRLLDCSFDNRRFWYIFSLV